MNYINWLGQIKLAETFWELQSATIQNTNIPLWITEFDPKYGEFYND
jgi:hypothetical protein